MFTSIGFFGSNFAAEGGIQTIVGPYTVHTFITSSTFNVIGSKELEVFLVGAGGSGRPGYGDNLGGSAAGGGGGGGGAFIETSMSFSTGLYSINVGLPGGGYPTLSSSAQPSTIVDSTATILLSAAAGGIGGTSTSSPLPSPLGPRDGASSSGSGGGAAVDAFGTLGTPGSGGIYGNDGGTGFVADKFGGGGGGAGQSGSSGATTSEGGIGKENNWRTGTNQYYAGGGGGGRLTGINVGGLGGGGNGGFGPSFEIHTDATSGAPNTGGGGGGGWQFQDYAKSANGGSGIVIIRYLTN